MVKMPNKANFSSHFALSHLKISRDGGKMEKKNQGLITNHYLLRIFCFLQGVVAERF